MTFVQFLILLALVLGLVYLGVFAYCNARIASFSASIKRRYRAFAVILGQKREVLLALSKEVKEAGAPFSEEDEMALTKVRWLRFKSENAKEIGETNEILTELEKRLSFLTMTKEVNSRESALLQESLTELSFNYQRVVAGYNSDVLGYNYWRALWPYRFIYFLIRLPFYQSLA